MVPVAGGPARQITFGPRGDSQPQWSPDGRSISFLSARGTGTRRGRAAAAGLRDASDGGEARRVTDAKEGVAAYAWAPDSRRIAFVATEPRTLEETGRGTLPRRRARVRRRPALPAPVGGRDRRRQRGDARHRGPGRTPSLPARRRGRPTGAESPSAPGLTEHAAGRAAGRVRRRRRHEARSTKVSTNFGRDSRPQWSPDGARIAWVADLNTAKPQWRRHGRQPDHAVAG